jgi:hypothetical protein
MVYLVGSIFGPIRFLLPVCRLCWFLYTLHIYAHFSSHFYKQLLMTGSSIYTETYIFDTYIFGTGYATLWSVNPFSFLCIRSLPSIVAEKKVGKQEVGIWRIQKRFPQYGIHIWSLWPVCRLSWFLYTLNIYAHFSSHFSQQLLMAEIWYLVTSFI